MTRLRTSSASTTLHLPNRFHRDKNFATDKGTSRSGQGTATVPILLHRCIQHPRRDRSEPGFGCWVSTPFQRGDSSTLMLAITVSLLLAWIIQGRDPIPGAIWSGSSLSCCFTSASPMPS
jgi:hypothetical protein